MNSSSSLLNHPTFRKTLLVKKIDLEKETSFKSAIDEAFNDPQKYLDLNQDKMIIGKLCKFPKIDPHFKIKHHTYVGTPAIFVRKDPTPKDSSKNTLMSFKTLDNRSILSNFAKKQQHSERNNLDFISDKGLNDIYSRYRTLKRRNHERVNDFIDDFDPRGKEELKKVLMLQEKCLKNKEDFNKTSQSLCKLIASKTKKKEEEILMNKTDGLRIKKEMTSIIESNKHLSEKYGSNSWVIGLRRPDKFEGTRYTYLNVGSVRNPTWTLFKDDANEKENLESIRKPNSFIKGDLKKLEYMSRTMTDFNCTNFRNFEDMDKLNIKGKDLIQSEYETSLNLKGRKIIHKKDAVYDDIIKREIIAKNIDPKTLVKLK